MNLIEFDKSYDLPVFNATIKRLNELLSAIDTIREVFKKYDGKVVRKNLTNNCVKAFDGDCYFQLCKSNDLDMSMYIRANGEITNYTYRREYVSIQLWLGAYGELDYKRTEKYIQDAEKKILDKIEVYKDAIENYDKYLDKARAVQRMYKEYDDTTNKLFRMNSLDVYYLPLAK